LGFLSLLAKPAADGQRDHEHLGGTRQRLGQLVVVAMRWLRHIRRWRDDQILGFAAVCVTFVIVLLLLFLTG
jgi:hypothetical protein